LVKKLEKGLEHAITEKEISDHVQQNIKSNFINWKRARVITTEDVVRLREEKEKGYQSRYQNSH
jgi:hypothetical protein